MASFILSRLRLVSIALEQLVGPLLVFTISFVHHLYFADDFVSSFFAGFALLSLIAVMALERLGLYVAAFLQLAFLGWVAIVGPWELHQQLFFSFSVSLALFASYLTSEQTTEPETPEHPSLAQQKEKLWQELFDARHEIKNLYQQKQELEASIGQQIAAASAELNEKILFLQHHLEAVMIDKQHLVEERQAAEEDIKKLLSHMHEMAVARDAAKQPQDEIPPAEKPTHFESLYKQLKGQFEEKSRTLDETRKELFKANEDVEMLKKKLDEQMPPTEEEKHLMKELAKMQKKLDSLKKKHEGELIGYEEVIQGLLQQLRDKQS